MATFRIIRDSLVGEGPTLGRLEAGDKTFQTLELPWKDNVVKISCIPTGTYPVTMDWSPKFQRRMPHIMGVEWRTDILIHPANSVEELQGCVAIGKARNMSTNPPMLAFGARNASDEFNTWLRGQPLPWTVDINYDDNGVLPRMNQVS